MRLSAYYRDKNGNVLIVPLASKTACEAVQEAKEWAERKNRANHALCMEGAYTYEPLEIVDHDRDGRSVWVHPRLGSRGWK